MKKPKISLDSEKIQAFFLNHIEKILLGIVVLLMVMLVLRGLRLPHLSKDMTPEALVNKSTSAEQYINQPRWTEVMQQKPRVVDFNLRQKVEEVQRKTEPLAYALPNSLSRPDFPKLLPRKDPELFAPINLVARAVVGALASYPNLKPGQEYHDPLFPNPSDEDIAKQKLKAKMDKKKKEREDAKLGGEGPGGMPGDGMQGPRGAKRGRQRPGQGDDSGYAGEGTRGRGSARGSATAGGPGMAGSYGGMPGEGGLAPNGLYQEAITIGYQPQDPQNTIARDVASVTLMAVVPFQKQIEEFEKKLAESLDYDPKRDYPTYLDFRVQRVDVTDLDPAAPVPEEAWKTLGQPQRDIIPELLGTETAPGLYAGYPQEVVDPTYLNEMLWLPPPPYLQRDLWDLLTHPDVPLYTGAKFETLAGTTPAAGAGGEEDAPTMPTFRAGGPGGGMPGGPGSEGGGYGGTGMRGGFSGGGSRMPGGGSATDGMGGGGMRGGGYSPMRGSSGGYGPTRGGEDSGGYGSGYGAVQTYTPPKYQLIRFIDTHVERGHKYRYRIRVFLEDPNHPDTMKYFPPSMASLDGDVQKRVRALDEADAKRPKNQQTGLPYRTAWMLSPWSEPSAVVELPSPDQALIAKATPERRQKIKNVDVPTADPSAEVLALAFDHSKIADVPGLQERVTRGSVLNFNIDKTKVIHPVTKEPIELEKYAMQTDILVADLMGGESMRAINTQLTPQSLTALGEMLVVDASGRLRVHNEADDIDNIRRYAVPKEDPKAAKAAADADSATGLSGDAPRRPARGRGD